MTKYIKVEYVTKKKSVMFLLCFFLGVFGVHRFYVGKTLTGFLYLFTFGLMGIGWIFDLFRILTDTFID